jgi:hypothetical protein
LVVTHTKSKGKDGDIKREGRLKGTKKGKKRKKEEG